MAHELRDGEWVKVDDAPDHRGSSPHVVDGDGNWVKATALQARSLAPVVGNPLLSDADLAGMRAEVALALPDTATLYQPSTTTDGQGGTANTWTSMGTVACRLLPIRLGKAERLAADHVSTTDGWNLHLPLGTIITTGWRVVVSGNSYEVVGINDPRTWELDELVRVKRVG